MFINAIKETMDFQNHCDSQIPREKIMHIAYGTDAKFMIGVGVCMTSIILNNPDLSFHFHIITDELTNKDKQRIDTLQNTYDNIQTTVYITNKDFFENLPSNELWSQAIYYRLIIAFILHNQADKVLYLDADTLCLGSLKDLSLINFNEKPVLVTIHPPKEAKKHIDRLNEKFGFMINEYFYSGFLYIDIDKWLKEKITEKTLDFVSKVKDLIFFDQDALNIIINKNKTIIDGKFNYCCYLPTFENKPPDDTIVVHYIGPHKPWQSWCSSKPTLRKSYLVCKNNSPWKDEPLTPPGTPRQFRYMAKCYRSEKYYIKSIQWWLKYFTKKAFNT